MHPIQEKLLRLAGTHDLGPMTYREIAKLIGETAPQKIKHHLMQLKESGLLNVDKERSLIERVKQGLSQNTRLFVVPIIGAANCGPAEIAARENVEGYIRVDRGMLRGARNVFAIRAVGHSMNKAKIDGKAIDDGDLVIVDGDGRAPTDGDYVLSVIDGGANIKRFYFDKKADQIVLRSESRENFPPIYIREEDAPDYIVNGRIVQVIKS